MNRTRIYQAGALLCGALCVGIYILILKEDTLYQTITPWVSQPLWQTYGINLAAMTGIGMSMTGALRSRERKKQTIFFILTALMVVVYGVVMGVMSYNIAYRMRNLSVALWPFVTFAAACQARQWMKKYKKNDLWGACGYFLAVLVLVWFLDTKMVQWETWGSEPMGILYLLGMGAVSWKMTETGQKSPGSNKAAWTVLILLGLVFLFALLTNDRVIEILGSLKNPVTSVTGSRDEINWLGYRGAAFMGIWTGDLSVMEEFFVSRLSRNCPLVWIGYVKGPGVMLLVLALEAGLLYCVISLAKEEARKDSWQKLPKILAAALICRAVLGLLADLFLIISPEMGVLLLKNSADVIMILYLIAQPSERGRSEDSGLAWRDNGGELIE